MPTDRTTSDQRGKIGVAFTAADTLFVTVFYNLPGVSDGEEIDYYAPTDRERLQRELIGNAEHYLTLFSDSEYEDHFSSAEYPPPEECLADAELETFRLALDPSEERGPLADLHPRSIFQGYRAVVDRRVRSNNLAICQEGVELFNSVMECALPTNDSSNPRCYMKLEAPKEFAPAFIDRLLDAVRIYKESQVCSRQLSYLGESLQPLQPLLTLLAKVVSNETWPKNDLALGKFLLLVDYYRELMQAWRGEAGV